MVTTLAQIAERSDSAVSIARAELVRAVRKAAEEGMTQADIAREIGRSQPEVSRLLHFNGTGQRAAALRRNRAAVREVIRQAGGHNVRVFGSVASGADNDGSDIDLLFTAGKPIGLMAIGRLERQISELVGTQVDLVPDNALRPEFRRRVLAEAIQL